MSWLVANHLMMSQFAQREDISDPEVIRQFANSMQTEERLNMLFVLTVADIRATNPTLWNSYRSSLLRQLYMYCRGELRLRNENSQSMHIDTIRQNLVSDARNDVLKGLDEVIKQDYLCNNLLEHIEDSYFLHQKIETIIWQLETIYKHKKRNQRFSALKPFSGTGTSESSAFIFTPIEKNYTFVALVTAAEKLGLNIVEAQIYRIEAIGYKLSCFALLDSNMQPLKDYKRINKLFVQQINENMGLDFSELKKSNLYIPSQLKQFKVSTHVTIKSLDNGAQIEVITADRAGLLAIIARAFVELGLMLNTAKITTLGERVEDAFWVLDRQTKGDIDESRHQKIIKVIQDRVDQQVE